MNTNNKRRLSAPIIDSGLCGHHRPVRVAKARAAIVMVLAASIGATWATSAAGAAPPATRSQHTGKVVKITWWNLWSGSNVPPLNALVARFNATHPGIQVTQLNVPSADGEAKLLSAIAAGDPPDLFTDWLDTIGSWAKAGLIEPLTPYLTGKYKGIVQSMPPGVSSAGEYNHTVYGLSMGEGDYELFYNKSMFRSAGIRTLPSTLSQFSQDQAKIWKITGGRVTQVGYYPFGTDSAALEGYFPMFGITHDGYVNGKYDLAANPHALTLMKWLATYSKYPYTAVSAFNSAFGSVPGGSEDPFAMGHAGIDMIGVWEVADGIKPDNPAMLKNFGTMAFPHVPGGPTGLATYDWGNYNVIPKGAKSPSAAFTFAAWLTGYSNPNYLDSTWIVPGGQLPDSRTESAAPAYLQWLKTNPWARVFVNALDSPASAPMLPTPTEGQFTTAMTTAMQLLATHKVTPMGALKYIDTNANKA